MCWDGEGEGTVAKGEEGEEGLTEQQMLDLFKQTSTFTVRSATAGALTSV